MSEPTNKILSIKAAADRLGKDRHWVSKQVKKGNIHGTKIDSNYYVSEAEIQRLTANKNQVAPIPASISQ